MFHGLHVWWYSIQRSTDGGRLLFFPSFLACPWDTCIQVGEANTVSTNAIISEYNGYLSAYVVQPDCTIVGATVVDAVYNKT